jgi:hypothetical protein
MAKQQYVMSQSELKSLKEDAQMNRSMLREIEREQYGAGSKGSSMDKAALEKQTRSLEALAAKGTAPTIRGKDKDKLAARAKELESIMSEGMPTREEMHDLRRHPHAPVKNLDWEKRNGKLAYEYKQVMRRLEPQDSGAGSVERFRR